MRKMKQILNFKSPKQMQSLREATIRKLIRIGKKKAFQCQTSKG